MIDEAGLPLELGLQGAHQEISCLKKAQGRPGQDDGHTGGPGYLDEHTQVAAAHIGLGGHPGLHKLLFDVGVDEGALAQAKEAWLPGYDSTVYWARGGGLMDLPLAGKGPLCAPYSIGDVACGMALVTGVTAALHKQKVAGEGELVLVIEHEKSWAAFCGVIGREDLIEDPRFAAQVAARVPENCKALMLILEDIMAAKNAGEWSMAFSKANIATSVAQHFSDVSTDPMAVANGYISNYTFPNGHTSVTVNSPIQFKENAAVDCPPAPALNQNGEEILKELGFHKLDIPEEHGGSGLDLYTMSAAIECMGRHDIGFASGFTTTAHWKIVLGAGTDEQKAWADRVFGEENKIGCFCLTEPSGGSDASAMRTTAVRNGDDHIINGTKCFITSAEYGEIFAVMAVTDKTKGTKDISCFMVDRNLPGVQDDRQRVRHAERHRRRSDLWRLRLLQGVSRGEAAEGRQGAVHRGGHDPDPEGRHRQASGQGILKTFSVVQKGRSSCSKR